MLLHRVLRRVTQFGCQFGCNEMMHFVAWHGRMLRQRPMLTNAVTAAVLMLAGDRVAQTLERRNEPATHRPQAERGVRSDKQSIGMDASMANEQSSTQSGSHTETSSAATRLDADQFVEVLQRQGSWTRTAILTFWSSCVNAPFFTWWYALLPRVAPGRPLLWVVATAAVCAPPLNAAFFIFSTAAEHAVQRPQPLSAESLDVVTAEIRERLEHRWLPTVVASTCTWAPVNLANFTFVPLEYRMLTASFFALLWNIFLSLQQHQTAGSEDTEDSGTGRSRTR